MKRVAEARLMPSDFGRTEAPPLRLIPIDRSGTLEEPIAAFPDAARTVCAATVALYEAVGFVPPWIGYLGIVDGQVIGTCAFKAPVNANRVEIAYFTFPEFEGRGFATRMAQELVSLAHGASPGVLMVAQTLPEENASTTILRRLGFQFAGPVQHPEDGLVWEWQLQTQAGRP